MSDRIRLLVDRFLAWPLPKSVRSDPCVTVDYPHQRSGTNLLTADEARQMFEYLFALDAPAASACPPPEGKLPCDILVPPHTVIRAGCPISTLLLAIEQRAKWIAEGKPVASIDLPGLRREQDDAS
jgi:hypothetical protein